MKYSTTPEEGRGVGEHKERREGEGLTERKEDLRSVVFLEETREKGAALRRRRHAPRRRDQF